MTLIGKSKLKINEIGNAYLHSKQRVGISKVEDTNIARAIVYDQHIIDSLYLSNKLNESEHNACDKYLGLIATSGAFLQSSAGAVDKIFTGQFYPYPPSCIIERQHCCSVTQFYPYPLCYIIEKQQCRSVTQFYPYPLCCIIERQ